MTASLATPLTGQRHPGPALGPLAIVFTVISHQQAEIPGRLFGKQAGSL